MNERGNVLAGLSILAFLIVSALIVAYFVYGIGMTIVVAFDQSFVALLP